jgi:hypothetical protein
MSNKSDKDVDDHESHRDADSDLKREQLSPPPTPIVADHSDLVDDPESWSDSRRYQRGGRKQKKKTRLPSAEESQLPWSQRNGRLDSFAESPTEEEMEEELLEPEIEPQPTTSQPTTSQPTKPATNGRKIRPKSSPFRSGISSFGVKRTKSGPPIGVHVDRGDEPKAQRKAAKTKSTRKCEKCKSGDVEDDAESAESVEEEEEKEEPPRKPVQIRLDLNLELEILLRAKIKGDITITFLE